MEEAARGILRLGFRGGPWAGNAVKFTQAGSVTMTASIKEFDGQSRLMIDVTDTGPGLTSAESQRLFKAFSQANGTMTRKHGGTGLGLTISHRLAMLMGGEVSLVATEPGKGSCFRLDLPCEPAYGAAIVGQLNAAKDVCASTAPTWSSSSASA